MIAKSVIVSATSAARSRSTSARTSASRSVVTSTKLSTAPPIRFSRCGREQPGQQPPVAHLHLALDRLQRREHGLRILGQRPVVEPW
jgi:hypothetical protein